jgi:hypothetical protein
VGGFVALKTPTRSCRRETVCLDPRLAFLNIRSEPKEDKMPSKDHGLTKRLKQALQDSAESRVLTEAFIAHQFRDAGDHMKTMFNFDINEVYLAHARASLKIDSRLSEDRLIQKAFEAAGLNPKDPGAWRTLVSIFAKVHFGAIGAPKIWDAERYQLLLDHSAEVSRQYGAKSDPEICRKLRAADPYKKFYERNKVATLRKRLREARDPNMNYYLRYPETDGVFAKYVRQQAEQLAPIDPAHLPNLAQLTRDVQEFLFKKWDLTPGSNSVPKG